MSRRTKWIMFIGYAVALAVCAPVMIFWFNSLLWVRDIPHIGVPLAILLALAFFGAGCYAPFIVVLLALRIMKFLDPSLEITLPFLRR